MYKKTSSAYFSLSWFVAELILSEIRSVAALVNCHWFTIAADLKGEQTKIKCLISRIMYERNYELLEELRIGFEMWKATQWLVKS